MEQGVLIQAGGTEMETVDSGPGAGRDAQGAPPLLEPKRLLHAEIGILGGP